MFYACLTTVEAWSFLLEGLQTRLRHGVRGPGLDAAKKDLRNLQQVGGPCWLGGRVGLAWFSHLNFNTKKHDLFDFTFYAGM